MDQKLLKALGNIGDALDALVEALDSKKESTSATGTALKGGDFGKQLAVISADIKSIKSDTQKILKNQETIIGISKEKNDKKTQSLEADPKKESQIKKGLGTILLIAVAVLAIGMAFKLVGSVDIISVIALALAITIVSIAFEKIAKLDLTVKSAAIASLTMVMISVALAISSIFLAMVIPVSPMKLLTGILIGAAFVLLLPAVGKIIASFKGLSWGEIAKAAVGLVFIMPAISLGIALSSYILSLIKPVGLMQIFTAILIGAVFVVLSFGMNKILTAFKDVDPKKAAKAAFIIPILFVAMSLAIMLSSSLLAMVVPISLMQFLTAIAISVTFVVLAYAMAPIIKSIGDMKWENLFKLPVLFTVMSIAIMLSSHILVETADIGLMKLFKIAILGVVLGIIALVMMLPLKLLGKMNVSDLLKGGLAMVIVATAVMISSLILALGNYEKYPSWQWALGVTLAMIPFGLGMVLFGYIAMADGGTSLLIGSIMVLVLARAIMASSHILALGNYEKFPPILWSLGVVAAILPFGMAAVTMGLIAVSGIGAIAIVLGAAMILVIAKTVVKTAEILSEGKYKVYPSILWSLGVISAMVPLGLGMVALGMIALSGVGAAAFLLGQPMMVSIASTVAQISNILATGKYDIKGMASWAISTALLYATFTPILLILGAIGMAAEVVKFFGGVDPFEVARGMIIKIAQTIVDVSFVLQKGSYKGGPTKQWAEGIAISLGAFSPIYAMLVRNEVMKFLGGEGGIGPAEFTEAITTVSLGIVSAAGFFANNSAAFKNGPPKEWAEGVGLAIGAFGPVYAALADSSFFSTQDENSPEAMSKGIMTVAMGIIDAANVFAANKTTFSEDYPSPAWGKGVGAAIGAFTPVFEALANKSFWRSGDKEIKLMSDGISKVSGAMASAATQISGAEWTNYPKAEWSTNVGNTLRSFFDVLEEIGKRKLKEKHLEQFDEIFSEMVYVVKKIGDNKDSFNFLIPYKYVPNLKSNLIGFINLADELKAIMISKDKKGNENEKSINMPYKIVSEMVSVAKLMGENSRHFTKVASFEKFDRLVLQHTGKNPGIIWKFISLALDIGEKVDYSKMQSGVYKIESIIDSIVNTAKILFKGKKFLSNTIDPNYMKSVGQNILDFNDLVKKLVESEKQGDKDLFSSMASGDFLTKDPIAKIAQRMITLADGYDKLANSLTKLGVAMRTLNITDVSTLGGLTSKMVEPSSISKNEGGFNVINKKNVNEINSKLGTDNKFGSKNSSIDSKLDEMIKLLSKIDKSTNSLDSTIRNMDSSDESANPFSMTKFTK